MTDEQPGSEAPQPSQPQRTSLRDVLGNVAYALNKDCSPGDVAELRRRVRPGGVMPRAFWLLYVRHVPASFQEAGEETWAVILSAMAELQDLYDPRAGCGRALTAIPINERRFLQIVRADGDALPDLVLTLTRYVRAKRVKLDLEPLARLLLYAGTRDDAKARRALARDFYTYFNLNG